MIWLIGLYTAGAQAVQLEVPIAVRWRIAEAIAADRDRAKRRGSIEPMLAAARILRPAPPLSSPSSA